jgi:hypothetical protein
VLAGTLALSWCVGLSFSAAQPTDLPKPPPHFMRGPGGLCADASNLYVIQGGRILQYALTDLTSLAATVDLPKPDLPASTASSGSESTEKIPPPPPMGGSGGCWAGDGALFVVAGPMLHRYTTSETGPVLDTSIELPRPEPPQTSQ